VSIWRGLKRDGEALHQLTVFCFSRGLDSFFRVSFVVLPFLTSLQWKQHKNDTMSTMIRVGMPTKQIMTTTTVEFFRTASLELF